MKRLMIVGFLLLFVPAAGAQLVEEEPLYEDNTGALGTASDEASDIVSESEASGKKEGEITLRRTSEGVEVYSGLNKVELIVENSDGWVGGVSVSPSNILFTPAGRPQLECPAQDLSDWYGPCKVPNVGVN